MSVGAGLGRLRRTAFAGMALLAGVGVVVESTASAWAQTYSYPQQTAPNYSYQPTTAAPNAAPITRISNLTVISSPTAVTVLKPHTRVVILTILTGPMAGVDIPIIPGDGRIGAGPVVVRGLVGLARLGLGLGLGWSRLGLGLWRGWGYGAATAGAITVAMGYTAAAGAAAVAGVTAVAVGAVVTAAAGAAVVAAMAGAAVTVNAGCGRIAG